MLRWAEGPTGQHIELGISEMNLFLLLGQLGWPGTCPGSRCCRSARSTTRSLPGPGRVHLRRCTPGSRFVVAGTPSGVTLAPEGGAHQSTITPSIGLELPGVTFIEPAYATALDWLLCDAFGRIAAGGRR